MHVLRIFSFLPMAIEAVNVKTEDGCAIRLAQHSMTEGSCCHKAPNPESAAMYADRTHAMAHSSSRCPERVPVSDWQLLPRQAGQNPFQINHGGALVLESLFVALVIRRQPRLP